MESAANVTKKSFARGYGVVVLNLMLYFLSGIGLYLPNIAVAHFAEAFQVDNAYLISLISFTTALNIVMLPVGQHLCMKVGSRLVSTCCILLDAVLGFGVLAFATSIPAYVVAMVAISICGSVGALACAPSIIAMWFPRTKGFWLGITTIGIPLAGVVTVPSVMFLKNSIGFRNTLLLIAALLLVIGIVNAFVVRDTPQSVGLHPDNKPYTEEEREKMRAAAAARAAKGDNYGWNIKSMLTNRNLILIIIAVGCFATSTNAYLTQAVPYLVERGFDPNLAASIFGLSSILGIIASFISGVLDQKFGVKAASIGYGVWLFVGFLLLTCLPTNTVAVIIACAMILASSGALANLSSSMYITCYGEAFLAINRMAMGANYIFRAFGPAFVAWGLTVLGSYQASFAMFTAVIAVATVVMCFVDTKTVQKPKY